jgi:hypothetical protein
LKGEQKRKMKNDLAIFSTYYLGLIGGTIGVFFGLLMCFRSGILGFTIILLSFAIGKFLIFKARRRTGHIIYNGGYI